MVERNMCNAVMRGIAVPPGSRAHHAQKDRVGAGISYVWPSVESSLSRTAVRIGKARSRSR